MNDKDWLFVVLVIVATFLVGFSTGHQIGYGAGAEQTDETGYVTCTTVNGSAMCFTSGDVKFEWLENASSTTRNGTMQLRAINQSENQ